MRSALESMWTWAALTVLIVLWLPLLGLIRLFDRDPAQYRTGRWFRFSMPPVVLHRHW